MSISLNFQRSHYPLIVLVHQFSDSASALAIIDYAPRNVYVSFGERLVPSIFISIVSNFTANSLQLPRFSNPRATTQL